MVVRACSLKMGITEEQLQAPTILIMRLPRMGTLRYVMLLGLQYFPLFSDRLAHGELSGALKLMMSSFLCESHPKLDPWHCSLAGVAALSTES